MMERPPNALRPEFHAPLKPTDDMLPLQNLGKLRGIRASSVIEANIVRRIDRIEDRP